MLKIYADSLSIAAGHRPRVEPPIPTPQKRHTGLKRFLPRRPIFVDLNNL